MTFRKSALALTLLAVAAPAARAQSIGDYVAYFALTVTPQAALAPLQFGADAATAPGSIDLRYGRISYGSDENFDDFALSASAPVGPGRLGATLGAVTCDGCDALLMLGLDYEQAMFVQQHEGNALAIGLAPAIGVAKPTGGQDGLAMSASLGLPLSISSGSDNRVTVFVTPGFGYGRLSEDGESESGTRPMLGLGLRLRTTSGIGFSIGAQKVFIDDGEMVMGAGLSIATGKR
jgi:hypothetical protein